MKVDEITNRPQPSCGRDMAAVAVSSHTPVASCACLAIVESWLRSFRILVTSRTNDRRTISRTDLRVSDIEQAGVDLLQ